MNYRHAYHAGNHGDVLKHSVLAAIIERLHDKPKPIVVIDTHAGAGTYDLASPEAAKTGEWQAGIGRLLAGAASLGLEPYLGIVRALNPDGALTTYPGSPAIAAALMRPGDRLVLCELHPEEHAALRRRARESRNASVHHRDGYEALGAFLPPPESRGLVVVDPPYEALDEWTRLAECLVSGHRRWPGGRWLAWYPVKERALIWRLEEALIEGGIPHMLSAELLVGPVDGVALAGSGLILVNPPFGIDRWLADVLPALAAVIAPQHGSHALRWLARS